MGSKLVVAVLGSAGLALAGAALVQSAPAGASVAGLVRVDQVGYLPTEVKQAYLMTTGPVTRADFAVVDAHGHKVYGGTVGHTNRGPWNTTYKGVYPISFSAVTAPGTYHIVVSGGASGSSPSFTVADASSLYHKAIVDGISFFQLQRDGTDVVPGALHRKPAHLNDASASVYAIPRFEEDSDVITDAKLTKLGGPVNVLGGWFDAGDYLKFTHTTAYGDVVLFAAERALGAASPSTLDSEAHFGARWLDQVWDEKTKTLYLQVGIGSGNDAGTFLGDHDIWRLPEKDDGDADPLDRYAAAHRPVFRANSPGQRISPNLVGRTSAAFALAAQVDADANPGLAAREYQSAVSLYAMADTASPPDPLATALPNAFYPEATWHDDMELGATEIALAAQALGHDDRPYLKDAAGFAKGYLAAETGDTLNLYDTSALAHADLVRALSNAGNPNVGISRATLVADLKRQLQSAATKAATDAFHAGGDYANFDVDSHTFGLLATQALYKGITRDASFDGFATQQRGWLFGANAWGTSFMVGQGSTYPKCMQHQVSNLAHSPAVGAVVNGPNDISQFEGGLGDFQDGMAICPANRKDPFAQFSTDASEYVDDVRSWQAVEPALDMTGSAVLGLALQQSLAASVSTTYEAETATLGGGSRVAVCPDCSGDAKVRFVGRGGTVTFAVSVPAAGAYRITVAYCADHARFTTVTVNGVAKTGLTLGDSGGFDTPGTRTFKAYLHRGTNTVAFGNPTDWAPDLDAITVSF
jgi:endoglucanase